MRLTFTSAAVQFQAISSSMEECRAECVGVYLCTHPDILRIFGYEGAEAERIFYVNWLNMVRAGT
jgi:dipeptidyl-peptidase-3